MQTRWPVLAITLLLWSCGNETSPDAQSDTELQAATASLVAERLNSDQTVFGLEIRAQAREQYVVRLWDQMRGGNGLSVLASVVLDHVRMGKPLVPSTKDWGIGPIQVRSYGSPSQRIPIQTLREWLKTWHRDGWKMDQSEWHHAAFEQGKAGLADRSTVTAKVHVRNGNRRAILEATLRVDWHDGLLDGPRSVAVDRLTILDQTGTPAFGVVHEIDPQRISKGSLTRLAPVITQDVTGNGRSDLILPQANLIYFNEGDFKFRADVLCQKPLPLAQSSVLADFDGDGVADLVGVDMKRRKMVLFHGTNTGRFLQDATVCSDIALVNPVGLSAGDIDGDGDLDLFVGQYDKPYENGQVATPYYDANDGLPSYLLLNDGHGRFQDVTDRAGLQAKRHRRTWRAVFADLDEDGDLDLAVVCDFAGVDIWRNDGTGAFTEVTHEWLDQSKAFGMASAIADFDGDGRLDFYLVGMSSTTASRLMQMGLAKPGFEKENDMRGPMTFGNRMLLGRGKGRFEQAPWAGRVARAGWAWGVTGSDFDNDGDRDIYVANGHISGQSAKDYCTRFWCHDIYLRTPEPSKSVDQLLKIEAKTLRDRQTSYNGYEHNMLYMDDGQRGYQNLAYLAGVAFEFDSRSVVGNDLNNDGLVDLLVSHKRNFQPSNWLLVCKNRLKNDRHWIGVRLAPSPGRPWPIGARVVAKAGGRTFAHLVVTGDSWCAQHDMVAHFGLGKIEKVDWVEVRWPDGTVSRLESPEVDKYHTLKAATGKKL